MGKPPKNLNPDHSLATYFGYELRRHRHEAGWGQQDLAARLHWARSLVSMLETATRTPKAEHAQALDAIFETDRFGHLFGLIMREEFPDFFRAFAQREPEAAEIRAFEPLVVPGLLQIEDYARAVMIEVQPPDRAEDAVSARMERQKILFREIPGPPHLFAIMDEAVIRRQVGGPEVMLAQLRHLLRMANRHNVTIQVLPSTVGAHPGLAGGFSLLRFAEGADIAYSAATRGGITIEQQKDVARIARYFDLIRAYARDADAGIRMIEEAQ